MTLGQLSRQSQDPPLAAAPAPTSSPGAAGNGYTLDTAASSHLLTRAPSHSIRPATCWWSGAA